MIAIWASIHREACEGNRAKRWGALASAEGLAARPAIAPMGHHRARRLGLAAPTAAGGTDLAIELLEAAYCGA
jgi:hypothetical protein